MASGENLEKLFKVFWNGKVAGSGIAEDRYDEEALVRVYKLSEEELRDLEKRLKRK